MGRAVLVLLGICCESECVWEALGLWRRAHTVVCLSGSTGIFCFAHDNNQPLDKASSVRV